MSLSNSDKERLAEILEKNRRGQGGFYSRTVKETTDESLALTRHGERSDDVPYHAYHNGEPACGAESESGYYTWDIEEAEEWRRPCQHCYRDTEGDR